MNCIKAASGAARAGELAIASINTVIARSVSSEAIQTILAVGKFLD
jgi:hypothetical protein